MKKIVLAGGTGNLGELLAHSFSKIGAVVYILTRSKRVSTDENIRYVEWDGTNLGDWGAVLDGADVLINMCGESVNTRFTKKNKKKLRDSRLVPTILLGEAVKQQRNAPRLWINFSGISIFGGLPGMHDEYSPARGQGFLASLSQAWEEAFLAISPQVTHQVILRISPVLMRGAGMFAELHPLVKWGLGGKVGVGDQRISWIHEEDFVRMVHCIATLDQPELIYHACSPFPVRNDAFMRELRQQVGVQFGLPLPTPFAKIGAYIKGVDASLLLESVSATTKSTLHAGFEFKYPYIHDAFKQLIKSV
ncbi:epimerase [Sphingobacterium sp. LRF_L2]|uniref:epimerase n=1 Tax=Sphingobacterium sp. LRF_L2 TaxID=3369421 RepID=UPI003F609CFC